MTRLFEKWRAASRLREVHRRQKLVEQHRELAQDALRRIQSAETEYTFEKAKEWLDQRRQRVVGPYAVEWYSHYDTLIAYPELWQEIERAIAIKERTMDKKF